jgi:hypothetical protein
VEKKIIKPLLNLFVSGCQYRVKERLGGPPMTDQELHTWIKQSIAGDHTAFSALYEHTRDDVYRTVTFLVNNKQDVHDVVSEALGA